MLGWQATRELWRLNYLPAVARTESLDPCRILIKRNRGQVAEIDALEGIEFLARNFHGMEQQREPDDGHVEIHSHCTQEARPLSLLMRGTIIEQQSTVCGMHPREGGDDRQRGVGTGP